MMAGQGAKTPLDKFSAFWLILLLIGIQGVLLAAGGLLFGSHQRPRGSAVARTVDGGGTAAHHQAPEVFVVEVAKDA